MMKLLKILVVWWSIFFVPIGIAFFIDMAAPGQAALGFGLFIVAVVISCGINDNKL